MSSGAIIAGKQNRYMRRFEDAGAADASSARTLEELGFRQSFHFRGLVQRGVFVEVSEGRYYIDLVSAQEFRVRRLIRIIVAVGVAVAAVLVLMWMR